MKHGVPTAHDVRLLQSRILECPGGPTYLDPCWQSAAVVTPSNVIRNKINAEHNAEYASQLQLHPLAVVAEDYPPHDAILPPDFRQELLALGDDVTNGLPGRLLLLPGMRLMLTDNLCTAQGLCNGTTGSLYGVVLAPNESIPHVAVEDGDSTGPIRLRTHPQCILVKLDDPVPTLPRFPGLPKSVVPIFEKTMSELGIKNYFKHKDMSIKRVQFPIVPCWAATDYKTQGATMDHILVDLVGFPTKRPSQQGVYVCLSRVHTLDGLAILDAFDASILYRKPMRQLRDEEMRLQFLARATKDAPDTSSQAVDVTMQPADADGDCSPGSFSQDPFPLPPCPFPQSVVPSDEIADMDVDEPNDALDLDAYEIQMLLDLDDDE